MPPASRKYRDLVQEWSELRNRPTLLFSVLGTPIREEHLLSVEKATRGQFFSELDLVICSNGGDPQTAYRINDLLRKRSRVIHGIIPGRARSAATLLAMACDDLVLSDRGNLGPLDMQTPGLNDKGRTEHRSATLTTKAIEAVIDYAVDVCVNAIRHIRIKDPRILLSVAKDLGSKAAAPMLTRVSLMDFGRSSRAMWAGVNYAENSLRMRNNPPTEEEARGIAWRLVFEYADHSFIIDDHQCREIGLPMAHPTKSESHLLDDLADWVARSSADAQEASIQLVHPATTPVTETGPQRKPRARPVTKKRDQRTRKRPGTPID